MLGLVVWPSSAQITFRRTRGLWIADVDGDADPDILFADYSDHEADSGRVAWIPNLGEGRFAEQHIIDFDFNGGESVTTADLDNDGDLDVLGTAREQDLVAWWENLGSGTFGPRKVLSDSADGAMWAIAADLNGDGSMDVIANHLLDATVSWWPNLGGGVFGEERLITDTVRKPRHTWPVDLDNDNDVDLLVSSRYLNQILWYQNDGNGVFDQVKVISDDAITIKWAYADDLDNDGDQDVLGTGYTDKTVFVHENLGGGNFGPKILLSDAADGARCVWTGDLDADGDPDVVHASEYDRKFAWYENLGSMVFGPQQVISGLTKGPKEIFPVDIDLDGDLDCVGITSYPDGHSKVMWFEHRPAGEPNTLQLMEYFSGLDEPIDLASVGSVVFVAERAGLVQWIEEGTRFAAHPFLDIRDRVQADPTTLGLMALAFHPDFDNSGYCFVAYHTGLDKLRISRFGPAAAVFADGLDPSTEAVLLELSLTGAERQADLAFGPDGYLYIALADGHAAPNAASPAQDLMDLRGKVLRIDVDAALPYAIPADNPYAGSGIAKGEIWFSGVHNPVGFGFDPATGALWLPDRGSMLADEFNRFSASSPGGENLGWPCQEGEQATGLACASGASLTAPLMELTPGGLFGGGIYQGQAMPSLQGRYLAVGSTDRWYAIDGFVDSAAVYEQYTALRRGVVALHGSASGEYHAVDREEGKVLRLGEYCSAQTPPTGLSVPKLGPNKAFVRLEPLPGAALYRYVGRREGMASSSSIYLSLNAQWVPDLRSGETYIWYVQAQCSDGTITPSSVEDTFQVPVLREQTATLPEPETMELFLIQEQGILHAEGVSTEARLRVVDLQGRVVEQYDRVGGWPLHLAVQARAAGLYMIEVEDKGRKTVLKWLLP
jgi:glucose/arabinose dehydrogenase